MTSNKKRDEIANEYSRLYFEKVCFKDGFDACNALWEERVKGLVNEFEHMIQFCTWLCEDSKKYPGTDAGNAARSRRTDAKSALENFRKQTE